MTDDYDNVYEADEAGPPPGSGGRLGAIGSTILGAVLCLAIVIGVGYWLNGLGSREAESLPVFRAELLPAKTRPKDPGGAETPYQDIRSYEVAAGGTTQASETALAPDPARPQAEDVAMGDLAPADTARSEPEVEETRAEVAEPDGAEEPASDVEPEPDESPAQVTAPPPVPPARPARPADIVEQTASASQQAIDQAAQLAARAAISPVQIQLGAFTDRAYTEAEWRRIADANRDLLGGRALAIQSTVSGGSKYFRLRVGPFSDRAEAKGVCEALKARGQDCLVAVNG